MFQNFFLKRLLAKQGVPPAQAELILAAIKKHPELFKQIAEEIKARVDRGEDQQAAALAVMQAHQEELRQAMEKGN